VERERYLSSVDLIRVLLVDDQAVVRAGLRMILENDPEIEIVAEASNGVEAVKGASMHRPTVVLMDIRMPGMDGIEATRQLVDAGNEARVLILTTYGIDEYVYDALKAGASGFLLKTESPERIIEAVKTVARGEALFAPQVTNILVQHFVSGGRPNPPEPAELKQLTDRELEIVKLLAHGLSNAEIASELYLSEATVKTHVARILLKLGLRDRVQVVVMAYERGLVRPGSHN
jgi:DNA-binding NarL/FixJ family response regulator